jgi:hypothetical protein
MLLFPECAKISVLITKINVRLAKIISIEGKKRVPVGIGVTFIDH